MKIRKFNELYTPEEKPNWESGDSNFYTFDCNITVKANSQEEAEDKMAIIANHPDMELGLYTLSVSSEDGEVTSNTKPFAGDMDSEDELISDEIAPENVMERKRNIMSGKFVHGVEYSQDGKVSGNNFAGRKPKKKGDHKPRYTRLKTEEEKKKWPDAKKHGFDTNL